MSPVGETPHVLFVALYHVVSFVPTLVRAGTHLNASSPSPVQIHAVVNSVTEAIPSWVRQWPIGNMPAEAQQQHFNLSHGKTHGASVFLWKPLLYRLVMVDRVIVLDLDVVIASNKGIGGLWSLFDDFGAGQVIGLAKEQGPTYERWGHRVGFNGGVQLHHLQRMRSAADRRTIRAVSAQSASTAVTYDEALATCAAGGCIGWDRIEPALGDQTLYTKLCLQQPHLCYVVPCGWNRQLSTKYYTIPAFKTSWHVCASCDLLHFNQPLLEGMVPTLQSGHLSLTCDSCRLGIAQTINHTKEHPSSSPRWTWGESKQYMGTVIDACCCGRTVK